jgi:hypothetical protein
VAATGGVPRVPAEQVFETGHRVQIRTPPGQRRGAEWTRHRLLRLDQGQSLSLLTNFNCPNVFLLSRWGKILCPPLGLILINA